MSRHRAVLAAIAGHTHGWRGAVRPAQPFDLAQTLRVLAVATPVRDALRATADGGLAGAVLVDEHPAAFRVAPAGGGALEVALWGARPWLPEAVSNALARLDRFLALSDDLGSLYARAANDPPFEAVVRAFYGYHPTRFPSAFEAACWAILTQHNHMSVASKMKRDLVNALGGSITVEGATYLAFPAPAQVADASPELLLATLRNEQRAIYLYGLAHAFRGIDEAFLREAPYPEAEAWLRAIPGVGPWSAQFTLVRGAGRADGPISVDGPLMRAVVEVYGHDLVSDTGQARRLAEAYRPHHVQWAHYLRVNSWLARKERGRRRAAELPAPPGPGG